MDTPTREEMDAKFDAFDTRVSYGLRALEEKIDTRFAQFEAKTEARFAQFEVRFAQFEARVEARFARFENEMLRTMMGFAKWMVGTTIALGAVGITAMVFVLNNAIPKAAPAPAPIVINLPAPSAPARP